MAHYYVDDEVQEIADYVGDSYYLAKMAVKESKMSSALQALSLWVRVRRSSILRGRS